MKQALIIRVDEYTIADLDVSVEEYQKLLNHQHGKIPVTVLGVGCEVDGNWEHDYHDIKLADGTTFDALSGYHLKVICPLENLKQLVKHDTMLAIEEGFSFKSW